MYIDISVTLIYKKEKQSFPCVKTEPASINISYKTHKTHLLRFNLAPFTLNRASLRLCTKAIAWDQYHRTC